MAVPHRLASARRNRVLDLDAVRDPWSSRTYALVGCCFPRATGRDVQLRIHASGVGACLLSNGHPATTRTSFYRARGHPWRGASRQTPAAARRLTRYALTAR